VPPETALLDTLRQVETPEGITLALRPAGPAARMWAYGIDLLLRALLLVTAASMLLPWKGLGGGLMMAIAFGVEWFYPVLFELLPGAATPGKRMLGLQVLMENGLPITPGASVLRNLLRAVDFLPMLYLLGGLTMLLRADFRRMGDLVAGTLVVYAPDALRVPPSAPGPALPPTHALSLVQQAAVLDLAARQRRLTPARLDELAQLLGDWLPVMPAPVTPATPATPGERLLALARWLMGERMAAPSPSPSSPLAANSQPGP
jgi:uncharacterized RDD family membrane protein YckC